MKDLKDGDIPRPLTLNKNSDRINKADNTYKEIEKKLGRGITDSENKAISKFIQNFKSSTVGINDFPGLSFFKGFIDIVQGKLIEISIFSFIGKINNYFNDGDYSRLFVAILSGILGYITSSQSFFKFWKRQGTAADSGIGAQLILMSFSLLVFGVWKAIFGLVLTTIAFIKS